jgi:hypothetical protein
MQLRSVTLTRTRPAVIVELIAMAVALTRLSFEADDAIIAVQKGRFGGHE